ncbi:MAG: hypothetical protein AAFP84_05625 [Actinomycetota bacterium]
MTTTTKRLLGGLAALVLLTVAVPALGGGTSTTTEVEAMDGAGPTLFVPLTSYRTMDTRIDTTGKLEPTGVGGAPFAQFVQFAIDEDGVVVNELKFPDNAVAVSYNVTVTETEGAGFVQVDGFAVATGQTSTVNWTGPNQTDANSGVSILTQAFDDTGAVGVFVGGTADAKAHVVLDITGYYVPAP